MTSKLLRYALLAAAVTAGPLVGPNPAGARGHDKGGAAFQCKGVGRGMHKAGMTERECRKAGGTVERNVGGAEEPSREPARARSGRRDYKGAEERNGTDLKFSCRGIGTGHHHKGMTKADCVKMGGSVEEAR